MNDLELALAMMVNPHEGIDTSEYEYSYNGTTEINAGLLYIGQMISHELLPPTNVKKRRRIVSGELNLDSLYGRLLNDQPDNAPGNVELFDPSGRFRLGRKDKLDLYRLQGVAQIPEPRNDENVIIAQLHNFWLRFHNYLLDKNYARTALQARELVSLTFQLIVVEEFLKSFLNKSVFEYFFIHNGADIMPQFNDIPAYFSHASFRFGHSCVRPDYKLKPNAWAQTLAMIFRQDKPLEDKFLINWKQFFSAKDFNQKTLLIDTLITPLMGEVPQQLDPVVHIAMANLKAGRDANLSLGLDFAKKVKDEYESKVGTNFVQLLNSSSDSRVEAVAIDELPLWPYILLEAQKKPQEGKKLGGLGSLLNAQVLRTAMCLADFSIFEPATHKMKEKDLFTYEYKKVLDRMGGWGHTLYSATSNGSSSIQMNTLIDLIN